MQSEETEARIDHVLATPVSRLRWATSYVLLAVVGTVVVLAAFSLPSGLAYRVSIGNAGCELPRMPPPRWHTYPLSGRGPESRWRCPV